MRPLPTPGERMEAIMRLFAPVHAVAEIGADHGILSAHLVKRKICQKIIVTDRSAVSLEKAKRLFFLHRLGESAVFCVGDGLLALPEPVDAALIAGMGAESIISILEKGKEKLGNAALILQANGKQRLLREWLFANRYTIDDEVIAKEKGRYYIVIRAVQDDKGRADTCCSEKCFMEKEAFLGPVLMRKRPAYWGEYLSFLQKCLTRERDLDCSALRWVAEELLGK